MRPTSRTSLAFLLAPWLVLSPVVAPEHLHEGDADHSAIAHRHFAPHDHHGSKFDHDEGRVLWLDDVALHQATYQFAVALAVRPATFGALPNPTSWVVVSTLDGAPPHGPPRATFWLRGPPLPPA
jgi:hypothetical protein